MKNFEIKNTAIGVNTVKDVDGVSRRVKVVISKMGNLDLDKDIIDHGAYNRTIKSRGPQGANLIYHLTDHNPTTKSLIAKFSELYVEGDNLVGVTDIPKTNIGNDYLELYKTGNITQHSVGFVTKQSEIMNKGKDDEHRVIKEIMLYEGSAVLWGANPETDTISVGKSLDKETAQKLFFDTLEEINNFTKLFRNGNLTDDTASLLEIHILNMTSKLQTIFESTTQPAFTKALDTGNDAGLMDVFKTFNQSLILQNESRRIESAISATRATA